MKYRYLFTTLLLAGAVHAEITGVSAAQACNYLTGTGLPTTTYRQQSDGDYRCSSPHIDIGTMPGKSGRLNNIAYTVSGGQQSIEALQLTIDVDNPEQATAIHRRLKDVANILARKLGTELSGALQGAIAAGSTFESKEGKYRVSVTRTDRSSGGYETKVSFE
jgi:hypothetical protein